MNTVTYNQRMSYVKYDNDTFRVFVNETVIDSWVPPVLHSDDKPEAMTGYSYTGPNEDGSTTIACKSADRDSLIGGIIRSKYSESEEDAIKTHQITLLKGGSISADKVAEYNAEWEGFDAFRKRAIAIVDNWLA